MKIMRFLTDLQKRISFKDNVEEPTIPEPVESDTQRLWDKYPISGHGVLDPADYNDTTAIYVNSGTGDDTNPGTSASPVKTLAVAQRLLSPTRTVIIATGSFQERITFESDYVTPGELAVVTPFRGHLIADNNQIVTLIAPENYDDPEETQPDWDYGVPPGGKLLLISPFVGARGDYLTVDNGRLRYCLPHDGQSDGDLDRYIWYISDGHRLIKTGQAVPAGRVLQSVQNFGFYNYIIFHMPQYWEFAGIGGVMEYRRPSGDLSDARDPNLYYGVGTEFPSSILPTSQLLAGTYGTSTHWLGSQYSGWYIAMCRARKHTGRFLFATVSFRAGSDNRPDLTTQKITIWKAYKIAGADILWEQFDEWEPDTASNEGVVRAIEVGNDIRIQIDTRGIALIPAGKNVYYVNAIASNLLGGFVVDGEIRVSTGGDFQKITINGNTKADDFVYFNDKYYATVGGVVYKSTDGVGGWSKAYEEGYNYFVRMSVINNVLFITSFAGDPKQILYTYDGINYYKKIIPNVPSRPSIFGGLVYGLNGRVVVHHTDVATYFGGPPSLIPTPPGGGATDTPYPIATFQEALINYEKMDYANFWHIDNIDISCKDQNGLVKAGSAITEGGAGL